MVNLLDIGKSGLLANRNALSVTSENIANANTEGYHKRIATSVEMLSAQATPTTKSNGGQGVKIDEIIRSFDKLLSDRLRTVSGTLESSKSFLPYIEMLEDRLTPGLGGMTEMLEGFFDAFGGLSLAPDDVGLREVAIESGRAFASTVADTALAMETMIDGVKDEASQHGERINRILKDLSEIQSAMTSVKDTGVRNPILDRRDLLTAELGELVDINVNISSRGTLKVTLGAAPGGPILLEGDEYAKVTINDDMFVAVDPYGVGNAVQTRRPGNGVLHGLYTAVSAIQETLADFDTWAQNLMTDMNAEHSAGLDLNNKRGENLFSMEGWKMTTAPINKGTASAVITVEEAANMLEGPLRMVFDGPRNLWTTYDDQNNLILESSNGATFPGLTVEIDGEPRSGDVFFLERTTGQAVNFRFALSKGEQLAMAGEIRIGVDAENTGTGGIIARAVTPLPESGQTDLSTVLTGSGSGVDAVEFLQAGVVGSIPRGTKSVELSSLASQSSVQFDLGGQAVAGLTSLDVTLPSGVYSIDLTQDVNGQALAPFTSLDDLAGALNSGLVGAPAVAPSTQPITLPSLKIAAAGSGTFMTLSSAGEDFQGASTLVGGGGALASSTISDANDASDIILFTREGRQISGPPLSEAEAAALLTTANGFFESAVYNADALNQTDGYRGLTMQRSVSGGDFVSELGLGNVPVTWNGGVDPAPNASYDVQLWMSGRDQGTLTVPIGASAERTAELLDEQFNIRAEAQTNVEMSFDANGRVSFGITGDNLSTLRVNAEISNGRLDGVASAINVLSGETGITAELSPDSSRIMLRHSRGETINILDFSHSTGGTMSMQRVSETGQPIDPAAIDLGAGTTDARLAGTIKVLSAGDFELAIDGVQQVAVQDPMQSGLISLSSKSAGTDQTFQFSFDPNADVSAGSDDGLEAVASGLSYDFTLVDNNGASHDFTFDGMSAGVQSSFDIANGIAQEMRDLAPSTRIAGDALAQLPADGMGFSVEFGDQTYHISMEAGALAITGPEEGRIIANFNSNNELVIETNGGELDGSMLRLSSNYRDAAAFGLGQATAPKAELTGQPVDFAALPAGVSTFDVSVDGTSYSMSVNNTGASLAITESAGFPGVANYDAANQTISFIIPADAGEVTIEGNATSQAAGFNVYGLRSSVDDNGLNLTSTTSDPIELSFVTTSVANERISLDNLPDEELLVVMRGPGALKLGGMLTKYSEEQLPGPVDIEVINATTGEIAVKDSNTGHSIATGFLDDLGRAQVAGYEITFKAGFAQGDVFTIEPNLDGAGDGSIAENIMDLRSRDSNTGRGGFADLYTSLLTDVGGQVKTAKDKIGTSQAVKDSTERAWAETSAVDLDAEAANLLQYQQAYQANAQILNVARQLFDTLINSV